MNARKDGRVQGTAGRWHTWSKVRGRKTGRRGWPRWGRALATPLTRTDHFLLSTFSEQSCFHLLYFASSHTLVNCECISPP